MAKRRVVVTGLGALSPLGADVASTWQGIINGKSGIRLITEFDTTDFKVKIAGLVPEFDISPYLSSKDVRKLDVFGQYAVVAATQALEDSGIEVSESNANRIGVAIGSGIGGLTYIEQNHRALIDQGPRKVSPFFIPSSIINMASGYVSIKHGLKGPNIALVSACTTGAHNVGYAARTISYGDADVMLAGGAEKASTPLGIAGFAAARALSSRNDDPEAASRPWDKDRDGFVLSDGAGVLVLEEYEHAKARGATIYAELTGFGTSADAFHITSPDEQGSGAIAAMTNAMHDAGAALEVVDYVNAHGTSTPTGDGLEALAIKKMFDERAAKLAVSSTKSMIGHMLGAAGALEAVFAVLAIRDQVAPPTINLHETDQDYGLDFVPNEARQMKIDGVLSNSFGFGGTNGALLFQRI